MDNEIFCQEIETKKMGRLLIKATNSGLISINVVLDKKMPQLEQSNPITEQTSDELNAYFEGKAKSFDVKFDLQVGTEFQRKVWNQLLTIPYGKTISYQDLANQLGNPLCIRAAASANGRNPIPIIIPCHRVIGSDNSLTGYALGIEFKRQLLALENPKRFGSVQGVLDF
jgi:methylated-DNA-[protein]-cysteine S-methyltransferase